MVEQGIFVTTDLFEATTPGENFINDRCFGEDFAEWLGERLLPSVSSVSEPIQEDWGWVLLVEFQGSCFTLTIGIMEEWIAHIPSQWQIGVVWERTQNLRRLFGRPPVEQLGTLVGLVRQILESEPQMRVGPESSPGV